MIFFLYVYIYYQFFKYLFNKNILLSVDLSSEESLWIIVILWFDNGLIKLHQLENKEEYTHVRNTCRKEHRLGKRSNRLLKLVQSSFATLRPVRVR